MGGPIVQCEALEEREDNFPKAQCAFVKDHRGDHRYPVRGEDCSPEIRLRRSLDDALDEVEKLKADVVEAKRMEKAAWDDWDAKREEFESWRSEARSSNEYNEKLVAEMTAYREACAADETAMIAKRNAVYRERDSCVAAMAKMALKLGYACGLGKHEASDEQWDRDWMNIVYIEVPHPSGKPAQLSWHIHDDELPMFSFLPPYDEKWDGHTTEEKYQHMAEFCGGGT